MGLTGRGIEASIASSRCRSPWVTADTDRTDGLEQTLGADGEERHRYSVAWLDLLGGRRASIGRAVVSRSDPLPARRPHAERRRPKRASRRPRRRVHTTRSAWRSPRLSWQRCCARQACAPSTPCTGARAAAGARPPAGARAHFFPLDVLGAWNRLYGTRGLMQYQFVIPIGPARTRYERCFELIRDAPPAGLPGRVQALRAQRSGTRCRFRWRAGRSRSTSRAAAPGLARRARDARRARRECRRAGLPDQGCAPAVATR